MSKQVPDLYAVLGIPNTATADQIKKAYRDLSKQWHPDVCKEPEAETRIKQITEAYKILSDPQKRADYEKDLKEQEERESYSYSFNNIFDTLFSTKANQFQPVDGADIHLDVYIDAEDIFLEKNKKTRFRKNKICPECTGKRCVGGTDPCQHCHGAGNLYRSVATPFGKIDSLEPCQKCNGYGFKHARNCPTCSGSGHIAGDETIEFKVTRNTTDGDIIRKVGEGHPGRGGGVPGDLFIKLHFRDDNYKVNESSLRVVKRIAFEDWLINKPIEITLPNKQKEIIQLPEKFQNGDIVAIPNYGLRKPNENQFGQLVVELQILLPHLSEQTASKISKVMVKNGSIGQET